MTRSTARADLRDTTSAAGPVGVPTRLIRKVLVANRGEIACRIMRTCHAMGIATVAVFSDADAHALHARQADEAVRIGGPTAAESYLDIAALVAAAQRTGADAIHPGYGFLAENAAFAAACQEAGITFIGPEPDVIARMGSKREARLLMAAAGVPVVPGYDGADQSDARFVEAARQIGYPLLVKAAAGGGGKGMRTVWREADLPEALAAGRREALSAFGDATLILEKLVLEPRHIEFQIFGDAYGTILHLGERECTIQRRHQKVIEETPSLALTPELRARMAAAALTVGRQLGYTNAGTVEFILDPAGQYYFLEVNTRLQVEHPVTELVTGQDLVRWQIRVAEGHPLPLRQDEVRFTGHAVEARVYAEDPENGFLPATGPVLLWRAPDGAGVRVDAGIAQGDAVSPYYDPLLAKICAHGADRDEALRRLERALAGTTLFGPRTNLGFLRRVLLHPAHLAGALSTGFIERHAADLLAPATLPAGSAGSPETAALVAALRRLLAQPAARPWRNNPNQPVIERFVPLAATGAPADDARDVIEVRLQARGRERYQATVVAAGQEAAWDVRVHAHEGADLTLERDGHLLRAVAVEADGHHWWVQVGGASHRLAWRSPLPEPEQRRGWSGSLVAPMPGQIVAVLVAEGQAVHAGQPLVTLEAMKMEHTIRAPHDGVVAAVHFRAGEQVAATAVLLDVRPATPGESADV